jgi:flagellar hook-basal body complex protein FliE
MPSIQGINPIAPAPSTGAIRSPEATPGPEKAFGDLFADAIGKVESYRANAEAATDRFMSGETDELHQVILAGQRAEIAFETFLQVRNKAVQAYQEVMRMQL